MIGKTTNFEDKDAILEMIAEFDEANSICMVAWAHLETSKDYEINKDCRTAGRCGNLPVIGSLKIQFLSFDETGFPLGF